MSININYHLILFSNACVGPIYTSNPAKNRTLWTVHHFSLSNCRYRNMFYDYYVFFFLFSFWNDENQTFIKSKSKEIRFWKPTCTVLHEVRPLIVVVFLSEFRSSDANFFLDVWILTCVDTNQLNKNCVA